MLLAIDAVSLVVFGIFYNVRWWMRHVGTTAWSVALRPGASRSLGSVFGALTVNLRLRELMLPVIIYPLLIPLLIAAIEVLTSFYRQPATHGRPAALGSKFW